MNAEVASALSLKVRTPSRRSSSARMRAAQWRSWSGSLALLPFEQAAFDGATASAARHALGLRAGDTLHLALAPAHGCKLVTLDQRLAKAAVELGVPVAEM